MRKKLNRLFFIASIAITAFAVVDQLRRPAAEREWHGNIVCVPYDFRAPSLQRFLAAWWNPDDPRLLTPRDFGVGWAVNLYQVKQLVSSSAPKDNAT